MHSELLHIEYCSRRTELEIAKRSKKTRISHFVQVAGKVWGAGAGPAPSGYGVERINGRCQTSKTKRKRT